MTLGWLVGLVAACADPPAAHPPGVLTVLQEQQPAWVRNFNPLQAAGGARWPTTAGIYEPMLVYNRLTGTWTPWLATDWTWTVPARSLTMTLRPGVQWSDGTPFRADDVVFTFTLLRDHPALDAAGAWGFLAAVTQPTPDTVRFDFQRPYAPGLAAIAHQPIVPAHRWAEVDDPVTFANPDPVGTGPFTEVTRFDAMIWELGRNPHYWQPGVPAVTALRFPAVGSNDQALLALVQGDVDWAGSFVPAADRTYAARDPEHFHWWFPAVADTVFLYPMTATPPLDDARVRRALSHAIDRDQIVRVALHGYVPPAHPTGLSDGYAGWRIDVSPADDWTRHDPAAAAALLDQAGWTRGADGQRRDAAGQALRVPILVPAGWSDWVRAAQVIARDLDAIGVDAPVQGLDFATWFDRVGRGDFALSLGWSSSGPTPYAFYRSLMGSATRRPLGEPAPSNWHRWSSPAADALLAAFEATSDPDAQQAIAADLQRAFVAAAPALPLFPTPGWGEANTRRFEGFPGPDDPYATLSPNATPDTLLVLTRLRPRAAP